MCVPFCAWRQNGLVEEQVNSGSIRARKEVKDPGQKRQSLLAGWAIVIWTSFPPGGVKEPFFLGSSLFDRGPSWHLTFPGQEEYLLSVYMHLRSEVYEGLLHGIGHGHLPACRKEEEAGLS